MGHEPNFWKLEMWNKFTCECDLLIFKNQRIVGKDWCKAPTRDEYIYWICLVCIKISIENVIEF
jgi:hypothetical protein